MKAEFDLIAAEHFFKRRNIDIHIEPIPYRYEDFQISCPLVNDILNHSTEII